MVDVFVIEDGFCWVGFVGGGVLVGGFVFGLGFVVVFVVGGGEDGGGVGVDFGCGEDYVWEFGGYFEGVMGGFEGGVGYEEFGVVYFFGFVDDILEVIGVF